MPFEGTGNGDSWEDTFLGLIVVHDDLASPYTPALAAALLTACMVLNGPLLFMGVPVAVLNGPLEMALRAVLVTSLSLGSALFLVIVVAFLLLGALLLPFTPVLKWSMSKTTLTQV